MMTPLQEGILGTVHNDLRGILRSLDTSEIADFAGISDLRASVMKSKIAAGEMLLKSGRTETNKEVMDGIVEDLARER